MQRFLPYEPQTVSETVPETSLAPCLRRVWHRARLEDGSLTSGQWFEQTSDGWRIAKDTAFFLRGHVARIRTPRPRAAGPAR